MAATTKGAEQAQPLLATAATAGAEPFRQRLQREWNHSTTATTMAETTGVEYNLKVCKSLFVPVPVGEEGGFVRLACLVKGMVREPGTQCGSRIPQVAVPATMDYNSALLPDPRPLSGGN